MTSETNPDFDFRFGYTGRERDETTGVMYYRARYYDPAVGRFLSKDPMGFAAGDANLYRYVFNLADPRITLEEVDRGIPTFVIPNDMLPYLDPPVIRNDFKIPPQ